jgi:hypothetical protein
MLALAREALERFDNNTDAAQAYLSERLVNDGQLREALVKAASSSRAHIADSISSV